MSLYTSTVIKCFNEKDENIFIKGITITFLFYRYPIYNEFLILPLHNFQTQKL